MKLIIQYVETDGCTYSAEHILPVEYESAEALCEHLYEAIRSAFAEGGQVMLGDYSVFASDFYERIEETRGKQMLNDEFHKGYVRVLNGSTTVA